MTDQSTDGLTDEQFRNVVLALHAPLVAELRAFGIPTADTDPLEALRLLIARCRDLEQRDDAADLARVQALLDHAQQRSIMVVKEAKDAYERGLAEGRAERASRIDALTRGAYEDGKGDGRAEGRRQATEGARKLTRRWWWPDLADARQDFERLVGPWEPDEQPEAARTIRICPRCGDPTTGFTGEPHTQMSNSNGYVETLSYSRTFLPCGCTKIIDARPAEQPPSDVPVLAAVGGVADDDAPWPICWAGHRGMLCDRKRDHLGDHVDIYGPLPDHTWAEPASGGVVEQAEAVKHARGCACGINDAGQRFTDLICRRTS